MVEKYDFKAIAANMQDVYERQAERFDRERPKHLMERKWLQRFDALLPENASVLDVGCGSGEPIAKFFIDAGHHVTGHDFSAAMIAMAAKRFPDHEWLVGDMRSLDLGRQFDGIIGWHSFFHLTQDEQRRTLPLFARHLKPGGALMLTIGDCAGEVTGHVGGELVYHASLAEKEYRTTLEGLGMTVLDLVFEDPDCGMASVLLAQMPEQVAKH